MALTHEQMEIKKIVSQYKREHPEEYKIVCDGIAMKKKMLRDEYASVEGSPDMRGLFEISETLSENLIIGLTEGAMMWFKTKDGARWFAKTYREFALPDSI